MVRERERVYLGPATPELHEFADGIALDGIHLVRQKFLEVEADLFPLELRLAMISRPGEQHVEHSHVLGTMDANRFPLQVLHRGDPEAAFAE